MKTRHDERYENDDTPSREIARKYREVIHDEEQDVNLALIHYRGGEDEFLLGKEYSLSVDSDDRATGADILAQLGWGDDTFRDESIEILMRLLDDPDVHVVCSVAVGLGHRSTELAIPRLVQLSANSDPLIRYGVVFGLTGHEDERAIEALITLAEDQDRDVRNWSVFGLGSQIDVNTPAIREGLQKALHDLDHEIRGEALVGLAKRDDPGVFDALIKEWENDDISLLSIEAAEETGDTRLFSHLTEISEILDLDHDPYFASRLADAIGACRPKP